MVIKTTLEDVVNALNGVTIHDGILELKVESCKKQFVIGDGYKIRLEGAVAITHQNL